MRVDNNLQQHLNWLLKEKANIPSRREKGLTPRGTQTIHSSGEGVEQRLKSSGQSTANPLPRNLPAPVQRTVPSTSTTIKASSTVIDLNYNQENTRLEQGPSSSLSDFKDTESQEDANHKFAADAMPALLNLSKNKETPRRLLTNRSNQQAFPIHENRSLRQDEVLEPVKVTHPGLNLLDTYEKQVAGRSNDFRTPQPKSRTGPNPEPTAFSTTSKPRAPVMPAGQVEAIDLTEDDELRLVTATFSPSKTTMDGFRMRQQTEPQTPSRREKLKRMDTQTATEPRIDSPDVDLPPPYSSCITGPDVASHRSLSPSARSAKNNAPRQTRKTISRTQSVPEVESEMDVEEEVEETETITKKSKKTRRTVIHRNSHDQDEARRPNITEPKSALGSSKIGPLDDLDKVLSRSFGGKEIVALPSVTSTAHPTIETNRIIPDSDDEFDDLVYDKIPSTVVIPAEDRICEVTTDTAEVPGTTSRNGLTPSVDVANANPRKPVKGPSKNALQIQEAGSETSRKLLPSALTTVVSKEASTQVATLSSNKDYATMEVDDLMILQDQNTEKQSYIKDAIRDIVSSSGSDIGQELLSLAQTLVSLEDDFERIKQAADMAIASLDEGKTTRITKAINVEATQFIQDSPRASSKSLLQGQAFNSQTLVKQTQFPSRVKVLHQTSQSPPPESTSFQMTFSSPIQKPKDSLKARFENSRNDLPFFFDDDEAPNLTAEMEDEDEYGVNDISDKEEDEADLDEQYENDDQDDLEGEDDYGGEEYDEILHQAEEFNPRPARAMSRKSPEPIDQSFESDSEVELIHQAPSIFRQHKQLMGPPSPPARSYSFNTEHAAPISQRPTNINMASPSMAYKWSKEVASALRQKFHLEGFRQNQLEAINATLSGEDVFVLMPTGGGKSLCYQLPAIIKGGKTRGVTFVVSPLLSLMHDQTDHLQALGIQATFLKGDMPAEARRFIDDALRSPDVEDMIQLLYVTPEMIANSTKLLDIMKDLDRKNRLARIVIDEAHCVSQWGHDFRPDYKALGSLRLTFERTPFIALTATANDRVQHDIKSVMHMERCKVFKQSFNRPNLRYEVRPKTKKCLEEIAGIINSEKYRGKCGIVYCLSRENCEQTAKDLRQDYRIQSHHYHAGLDMDMRVQVQKDWQAGKYKVIVATIAFGMGIDKSDVRFVIHQTLPKTLEGLYQETGRAGRDGKPAGCYLFYSYHDTMALQRFIDKSEADWQYRRAQKEALLKVVSYCENKQDCRRKQVLDYFNETFNPEECRRTCDNCAAGLTFNKRDVTSETRDIINIVKQFEHGENYTLIHVIEVFKGSKAAKVVQAGHDRLREHGSGSKWQKSECDRLVRHLVAIHVLQEYHKQNKMGFSSSYVKLGPSANQYLFSDKTLSMAFQSTPTKATKTRNANNDDMFHSTNVSSPVQESIRRGNSSIRKSRQAASDYSQADSLGFMPIRGSTKKRKSDGPIELETVREKRQRPITLSQDPVLSKMSPYEQDILDRFMKEAKRIRENICNDLGLRVESVFTDNELRTMGLALPCKKQEILQLANINRPRLIQYWSKFLPICQTYSNERDANLNDTVQNQAMVIPVDDDDDDDDDEIYGDGFDDFDDEDYNEGESSHFFNGPSQAAQNFNSQFAALSAPSSKSKRGASTSEGRPAAARAGKRTLPFDDNNKRARKVPAKRKAATTARRRESAGMSRAAGGARSQTSSRGRGRPPGGAAAGRSQAASGGGGMIRSMADINF